MPKLEDDSSRKIDYEACEFACSKERGLALGGANTQQNGNDVPFLLREKIAVEFSSRLQKNLK